MQYEMTVAETVQEFDLSASATTQKYNIVHSEAINVQFYPEYQGEVTVTPTAETQILQTKDTALLSNITINPIPSNYGLIEYNGSVLRVS